SNKSISSPSAVLLLRRNGLPAAWAISPTFQRDRPVTRTIVESATKTVVIGFDEPFCVIGERINPTGRKKLAAELEAGNFATVEADALAQVAAGAAILDVNAGVVYNSNPDPNQTEPPLMRQMIELVQAT